MSANADYKAEDRADLIQALDLNRCRELQVKSVLAANLWLAINLAAQRSDTADIRQKFETLTTLYRTTHALVKALGSKEVDNG